jgi:hypothetical protein
MQRENIEKQDLEKLKGLFEQKNYVVYYDDSAVMNLEQLLNEIEKKRHRLRYLGFSESEILKIILQGDNLEEKVLEPDVFEQLMEYIKINIPNRVGCPVSISDGESLTHHLTHEPATR